MSSRARKKTTKDDHIISITDTRSQSSSTSSSLSSPLLPLSSSDSSDSLSSHFTTQQSGTKQKKAAVKSSVDQLIGKSEDRSLYKRDGLAPGDEEAEKKTKDPKLTFRRLFSQARPERALLIGATVCLFLSALLNLAVPAFVGTIIDSISDGASADASRANNYLYHLIAGLGFGSSPRNILNVSVVLLLIIITLASVFASIRGYWFTLAGERVVARLRNQLFSHLSRLEVGFFDVTRTGELVNRLSTDTTVLKDAVTINISMALRWASTIVVGIGYLFFISWKLTLVMLSVVPLVAVGARLYGKRIKLLSKATQDALASATETAEESFSHIRTVRSFSRELLQSALYADKINTTFLLGKRIAWLYGVFIGIISMVAMGAMILVLWYGATLVIDGEMSTGTLTSFVLYTLTVGIALAALSGLFAQFMSALGACDRVFELLDRQPGITDPASVSSASLPLFVGKVTLHDVRFAYPARADVEVLKGISFSLHPGTVTALVGESGGGKSTVVSLIERWYDIPDDGKHGWIEIDGQPLRSLPLLHLHRHIGLVSQNPVLFATTIRQNLLYGCRGEGDEDEDKVAEVSDDKLQAACEMANAWQFIQAFPDKLDTMVGERGVRLSGGQLQRVAIARAILLNPRILIADEATSSLDAESEFHVQQALDRLMQGRTVLVIAHRLSTVKQADNVIVVEKGKVVESGTHAELLERGGSYSRLVARQLSGDGVSEAEEEQREIRRLKRRAERERKETENADDDDGVQTQKSTKGGIVHEMKREVAVEALRDQDKQQQMEVMADNEEDDDDVTAETSNDRYGPGSTESRARTVV